ncbi:tRNA pseudouridine(55) synthase TruB [Sarcina ventriculi]|uniref:tRNA pseudouridine(55) synthase TruB n=1 Tax=Sarcina ventriculi TaxID=1267 RepID=UPI0018AB5CAD|nr:tRNA pseudouridine(55) synthase TruB [Sarcina ventriculi]
MNGVINIIKNTGMTSFDVVARVRKITKEKKVGHTGTLDPEAFGVLPICLGKATKIIDYMMENEKAYRVSFKLGIVTDTYDLEGKIIREKDASNVGKEEIIRVISNFIGNIKQVPPMYSALKQNGVKLYELARKGIEVKREARDITIYKIENIDIQDEICMDVYCSKGTYIRSLCFDIGEELGVGATMTKLCRIKNGNFTLENGLNIDDLNEENVKERIISIEEALCRFDKIVVNNKFTKLLVNGVRVYDKRLCKDIIKNNKLYRVYDDLNTFIGLGRKDDSGFKIEKLLIEKNN